MPAISLAALTVLDAGPAGQIRAAAEAGFGYVGLRLNPLLPTDQVIAGHQDKQDEIERLLRETGLKVLEVGVFPIRAGMQVEDLAPVLGFSHKLGARFIVCPVEDTDRARSIDTFGHLCDLAETCALEALVEFNPYSACRDIDQALDIVESCGRSNARLLIDVLHLSRSGGSPRDLVRIAPELIALVHFCDAKTPDLAGRSEEELRKESRTARLYPGEGELWLDELLDVLPANTPLSIEAPTARDAGRPAAERAKNALQATLKLLRQRGPHGLHRT